jgi:ferredoxin
MLSTLHRLANGNQLERAAFAALESMALPSLLETEKAIVTNGIAYTLHSSNNRLEIRCAVNSNDELVTFAKRLQERYSTIEGFDIHHKLKWGVPYLVARFRAQVFLLEIFAQVCAIESANELEVEIDGLRYKVNRKETLIQIADQLDVAIVFGCFSGRCGLCKVEVLTGAEYLSPINEMESQLLSDMDAGPRTRLACQCSVTGFVSLST